MFCIRLDFGIIGQYGPSSGQLYIFFLVDERDYNLKQQVITFIPTSKRIFHANFFQINECYQF